MTGGTKGGSLRERAEAVLIELAEMENPGRWAMARVAAAKAVLDAQPKAVAIPGWAPNEALEEPVEALEDDGSWSAEPH
jgi:hypothetical protein